MVYQRAFNHVKTTITRVLAYPDYSIVFESYTDTSSNELRTVTTWGYCHMRSLRLSRKPTMNAVQCYRTLIVLKQ